MSLVEMSLREIEKDHVLAEVVIMITLIIIRHIMNIVIVDHIIIS